MTGTNPRELRSTIRRALAAGPFVRDLPEPFPAPYFDVTVRSTKTGPVSVTVAWPSGPSEADVAAAVADAAGNVDVVVTTTRTPMWACGYYHQSDKDAWLHHEGFDAQRTHPDVWDDIDPSCVACGHDGGWDHTDIAERIWDELDQRGERPETVCTPGNYARCPHCVGGRTGILRGRPQACEFCGDLRGTFGGGVYDLDDTDQAQRYAAAVAAVAAAHAPTT